MKVDYSTHVVDRPAGDYITALKADIAELDGELYGYLGFSAYFRLDVGNKSLEFELSVSSPYEFREL